MKKHEIKQAIQDALDVGGSVTAPVGGTKVAIKLDDNFTLEFAHLEALAAGLGTKLINIERSGFSEGYSEMTPGSEGTIEIVITMPEPVTP